MELEYQTYRPIKLALLERGLSEIHMHDTCSGQYFSIEEPDDATCAALEELLAELGAAPVYTEDRTEFTLAEM